MDRENEGGEMNYKSLKKAGTKWVDLNSGKMPEEYRMCLFALSGVESLGVAPSVVVGYLKLQSYGFLIVTPGAVRCPGQRVTHWADILGDDFTAPHWQMAQPDKAERELRRKKKG